MLIFKELTKVYENTLNSSLLLILAYFSTISSYESRLISFF